MHREKTLDIHGNPITLWIVYRRGVEYAFNSYLAAERYQKSWQ